MTDDVKALIAEAREWVKWNYGISRSENQNVAFIIERLADALGAATPAPAVDRDALVNFLRQDENYTHDPEGDGWVFSAEMATIGLLASGLLRDVRDVQAEALEQAAGDFAPGATGASTARIRNWLRARAQAIREARNG